MSVMCVKTGAITFVSNYGLWYNGDAYHSTSDGGKTGTWLIRCNPTPWAPDVGDVPDIYVDLCSDGLLWEDKNYHYIIVPGDGRHVIPQHMHNFSFRKG